MRRIVVLPEPEGPISASFSPGSTFSDSPFSTLNAPKLLVMPSMRMIGAVMTSCKTQAMTGRCARLRNHVNSQNSIMTIFQANMKLDCQQQMLGIAPQQGGHGAKPVFELCLDRRAQ